MTSSDLPITFDPDYGKVVTRVLPGIVAMMTLCGLFFLTTSSKTGLWLAVASFAVGAGFLGLYLWFLIYRKIEFRKDKIVVYRYLFPDREEAYEEVTGVSSTGFRLGGFPVACHTMDNSAELHSILEGLLERGKIQADESGGLTEDFKQNLTATLKAALLGIVFWFLFDILGWAPTAVPEAVTSYGVILVTLIIGAPLFKRLSSE